MTAPDARPGIEGRDCPVCGRPAPTPLATIGNVAVHVNTLHDSADAARAVPRGDLELAFCDGCAFIWNVAFDNSLIAYDGDYENSLHHSAAFDEYATQLSQRLVDHYALERRHIVEIGCGQATFLRRLCEIGDNRGTGFDPAYIGPERDGPVTVHRELYSEAGLHDEDADFVCCQHVLEHLEDPLGFLRSVRRSLRAEAGTPLYLEVPNGEYQLENGVVWDMIYAHYSTFTAPSLTRLVERAGFEVIERGVSFGDQYLWLVARPTDEGRDTDIAADVDATRTLAHRFAAGYTDTVSRWRQRIDAFASQGLRVVLWGAGAKGVTLLNTLDPVTGVGAAVDVNPRKHGAFLPGSGVLVLAPDTLPKHSPDVVILANPIYRDEVAATLSRLGQSADVVCV